MTNDQAKDQLLTVIAQGLQTASTLYLPGGAIPTRWPYMPQEALESTHGFWARVVYTAISSPQTALARINGVSKYETTVQVLVQLNAPLTVPDAGNIAEGMAAVIQDALRHGTPQGGIIVMNPTMRSSGNNDTHYIINVSATCKYDTRA